jgi:predicted TIM-barrel fold metal-dependent hydrolase
MTIDLKKADRVVALEEHFLVPSLVEERFDPVSMNMNWLTPPLKAQLADLGAGRLRDMDAGGVTQQIISASMPGADLIDGNEGIRFAIETNDHLAAAVKANPGRLGGFAHLPMRTPAAAADELERAVRDLGFRGAMVNGLTDGRFLDDRRFAPVLERASRLEVPIYIHPNIPPKAVYESYYQGLPGNAGSLLASGLFGWHAETGIHIFRLALSGAFERYPGLTAIVGHMGEMLPFMLGRADAILLGPGGHTRPISETIVERVYITTSGMFTIPPFLNALTTFGADRIMYSVDYPYSGHAPGKALLDLLPVSPADRSKIAHGNADRLLKLDPTL